MALPPSCADRLEILRFLTSLSSMALSGSAGGQLYTFHMTLTINNAKWLVFALQPAVRTEFLRTKKTNFIIQQKDEQAQPRNIYSGKFAPYPASPPPRSKCRVSHYLYCLLSPLATHATPSTSYSFLFFSRQCVFCVGG
jgi:hypothetical protein